MISDKHKLIFIHIPRTSGTSIEKMFAIDMDKESGKHLKASEIKRLAGAEKWNTYFKFSLVRNPWERVGSLYHQPAFKNINFLSGKNIKYFLSNYQPKKHEHGFTCSDYLDVDDIDLVGKYEKREEVIEHMCQQSKLAIDNTKQYFLRRTESHSKPWHSYFTLDDFYKVSEMYREDIRRFGYDAEKYLSMLTM